MTDAPVRPDTAAAAVLDWPVDRGGTAVVTADGTSLVWRPGTGPYDRFPVASVTKLLTALGALTAVNVGLLGLDTPVQVDDDPRWGRIPSAGAPASQTTVRHLLAHASGLPQEASGLRRAPGTRRVYSNTGFRLLGETVNQATGKPLQDWLDETVFGPLGMKQTELVSYKGHPEDPAAGAVSTVPDLAALAACLLRGDPPLLSPALLDEATTSQFPELAGLVPGVGRYSPCDWGLGFELHGTKSPHWMGNRRSPATFGHFGALGGFLWVDPVAEVAAVAATDRPFGDDDWAMATWPAWSDALAST